MNFTCPYCSHHTTITNPNHFSLWERIEIAKSDRGDVGFYLTAITCPNEECNKLWLKLELCRAQRTAYGEWKKSAAIETWQLLPESEARVLPDYIPVPIQEDYKEACRIRDLSPKASATLARRCLQGMIRNFWSVRKATLKEEIETLEDKVDIDTWESIDAVRSVGNIGAHMEKDINIMVEVEPGEAQLLIGLIEQLIADWYVQKKDREERMRKVKQLAENKNQQKNP